MKKKLLCTILGLSLVMTIAIMPAYAVSVSVGNTSGEQDAAGNISISKQETEELLSEKLEEVADVLGNENMDMAMCPMSDGSLYAVKAYDNSQWKRRLSCPLQHRAVMRCGKTMETDTLQERQRSQ